MSKSGGCFSNFLRSDDVTRTMSKGGVLVNVQEWGVFFSAVGRRHADNVQGGGVLVKNLVSVPGPPPFKNPGSAPGT